MTKEETKEFEELSLQVFGNRYTWRKLTKRGINAGTDRDLPYVVRRIPLSKQQAKDYMLKTLQMRLEVIKDMEKKDV